MKNKVEKIVITQKIGEVNANGRIYDSKAMEDAIKRWKYKSDTSGLVFLETEGDLKHHSVLRDVVGQTENVKIEDDVMYITADIFH